MNTETIMKNVNILADVNTLTNEDWLKIRKTGVGGSEIAALFGKSNYASPLSVYMDKMSNQINEIENEFIEWGKTLEPIIREKFPKKFWSTTGYQIDVEEFSYMMQSKENPYMLANIDGLLAPINDYKFNVQVAEGEWKNASYQLDN